MRTIKEIQDELLELERVIKTDYSRYGDLSEYVREDLLKVLKRIRCSLNKPMRIDFGENK